MGVTGDWLQDDNQVIKAAVNHICLIILSSK